MCGVIAMKNMGQLMTPATQALLEANLDLALLDYTQGQARYEVMSDLALRASIQAGCAHRS